MRIRLSHLASLLVSAYPVVIITRTKLKTGMFMWVLVKFGAEGRSLHIYLQEP